MRSIRILDCTLRDGGFVNDWNFGVDSIKNIIGRLVKANVEIVEVGWLDGRRGYDLNRSILPDTDSYKPLLYNVSPSKSMLIAMIDYGTCGIEAISEQCDSVLDGIRVIFKKQHADEALAFCSEIKAKGYKVFVNPVSITGYTDAELVTLSEKVNLLRPYAMSVVDTYGLLHKKELLHYFGILDTRLAEGIAIGFHAHNNFQLAYANSIELMALESNRDLVIDGSLHGMGKGAGNTCTELLAMHLNSNYAGSYVIDELLEAIDVDITKTFVKTYWGYSLIHFMAASNNCHPDYVSTMYHKNRLSVRAITDILTQLDPSHKLAFNRELLESIYRTISP